LRSKPLADAGVRFTSRRVKIQEQCLHELLLNEDLMSGNVERISRNMENLTPEHAFKF
jgi:hypothetical protein